MTRTLSGSVRADSSEALLGYVDKESRIKDQVSMCLAVASRDNNDCIKNTCHAWMMPLALLPLRRRYNDEVNEALVA